MEIKIPEVTVLTCQYYLHFGPEYEDRQVFSRDEVMCPSMWPEGAQTAKIFDVFVAKAIVKGETITLLSGRENVSEIYERSNSGTIITPEERPSWISRIGLLRSSVALEGPGKRLTLSTTLFLVER
jgi:hypothetical protein